MKQTGRKTLGVFWSAPLRLAGLVLLLAQEQQEGSCLTWYSGPLLDSDNGLALTDASFLLGLLGSNLVRWFYHHLPHRRAEGRVGDVFGLTFTD